MCDNKMKISVDEYLKNPSKAKDMADMFGVDVMPVSCNHGQFVATDKFDKDNMDNTLYTLKERMGASQEGGEK